MSTVVATDETVGPRNIAVINGSTTTFSCIIHAPESEVCWTRLGILSGFKGYLYRQGYLSAACDNSKCNVTFDNETACYTLTINSVQHYDAGFYECSSCLGKDLQAAQLIVLHPLADIGMQMYKFCI